MMQSTWTRRAERGGVLTIVAVLLAFTVVLGMAAISVDVGRLLAERGQMQNSADAAALSLAQSCAEGDCLVDAGNLQQLADENALDSTTGVASQCALNIPSAITTNLPACPTPSGALADCAALPPQVASDAAIVEVRTKTQSGASGSETDGMANWLAGLMGQTTSSAGACARAAFGPVGDFKGSLPLAVSICEWKRYTGSEVTGGLDPALPDPPEGPAPGYDSVVGNEIPDWPAPYAGWPNEVGKEQYVMFHDDDSTDCTYNGKDTAGGFGWLENDSCKTQIDKGADDNYWARIKTGVAVPADCKAVLDALQGKELLVPIFDCLVKSFGTPSLTTLPDACDGEYTNGSGTGGAQTYYHLNGFASFYLSGNKLSPSSGKESLINSVLPCSNSSVEHAGPYASDPAVAPQPNPWSGEAGRCISGWFVEKALLAPGTSIGGSGTPSFGTTQVIAAG
jgi:Flp pilus assembly protein TadG